MTDTMRKAVFPLDEGDVTITFPSEISTEGLAELNQHFEIFLKIWRKKARNAAEVEVVEDKP